MCVQINIPLQTKKNPKRNEGFFFVLSFIRTTLNKELSTNKLIHNEGLQLDLILLLCSLESTRK